MVEAYPLYWPEGWKREPSRQKAPFKTNANKAHAMLLKEIRMLGGSGVIVSSNCPLGAQGKMLFDSRPADSGVAVYFNLKNRSMVFACDQYESARDNVTAIAKTIEALRGIERWGASDMMERAFTGFKALGAPTAEEWWDILGCQPNATKVIIQARYRELARTAHPDSGGSHNAMQRLNSARDKALASLGGVR